jgi:hypothetical protein
MRIDKVDLLFKRLAEKVFQGRQPLGMGIVGDLISLIVSYSHGRFPATDIDKALAETFGDLTMLHHPYMTSIGARIGFPVVDHGTTHPVATCMITSYNGASHDVRPNNSVFKAPYRVLRSRDARSEILIKDA